MKKIVTALALLACFPFFTVGQSVGVGTASPHASAQLDVSSSTRGFLPPRMSWAEIQAIASPAEGLLVFDAGLHRYRMYANGKWEVLGVEKKDLNDPTGYFSHATATGTAQVFSNDVACLPDGSLLVTGSYTGQPAFGNFILPPAAASKAFLVKYDNIGNVSWAKSFDGSGGSAFGVKTSSDGTGNIYLAMGFSGTVDLDPGAGVDNHVSSGAIDAGMVKLDANGNYTWGKHVGGTSDEFNSGMALDASSNIILYGAFGATVDFDPGVGTANLVSAGLIDGFFAMYDNNGLFVYAKKIGGIVNDFVYDLAISSGTIVIGGRFANTCDFDPGAGVTALSSVGGGNDIFFGKYDMSGNLLFIKQVAGAGTDELSDLAVDGSGNIYLCGYFEQTCDFNPDAGVNNFTAMGFADGFFARYTSTGTYALTNIITGPNAESPSAIFVDNAGNITIAGTFSSGATDFDPGAPVLNIAFNALNDVFLAKYTNAGLPLWAKGMGSVAENDAFNGMAVSSDGKLIAVTGYTAAPKYKNFSNELILNNTTRYFLSRYEE